MLIKKTPNVNCDYSIKLNVWLLLIFYIYRCHIVLI